MNNQKHAKKNWKRLRSGTLSWEIFRSRAAIIEAIRKFFSERGFLEIEAPVLTRFPSLDANITSMETASRLPGGDKRVLYLHTSPEHAMKKLLSAETPPLFFLGKVFRDEEIGALHNPEFTLLEWYRTKADYREIMTETQELILTLADRICGHTSVTYQGEKVDLASPWKMTTIRDVFQRYVGIDLDGTEHIEQLQAAARAHSIHFQETDDWETLFFRLFLERIEPHLGRPVPQFVTDYPVSMGQMARRKDKNPLWVERAELYIAGLELANGYSELLDSKELQQRFDKARTETQRKNGRALPVDSELLEALTADIPPSAGMALGVDRLTMLLLDQADIREVILFPQHEFD